MAPQVGDQAPDFTLPDQHGNPVSLSGLRGQTVVLYFYPKADTPGCTTQACGVRDHQADYQQANAVVLGVSPDPVAPIAKARSGPAGEGVSGAMKSIPNRSLPSGETSATCGDFPAATVEPEMAVREPSFPTLKAV